MGCVSCDGELPQNARFCPFCGSATGSVAVAAPVEERKVVTVVFCDLVGSTALSGVLDPETLRTVVLRYFDLMRERLEAFGGTVEKFIGDAVMAVFGVPVTHEDDAARALAAALGMLDAVRELNERELGPSLGISLGVRIGVNTGAAVTSTDVSTRQALVSGETVNIAARLEQHAAEGEVLIGPETMRATGASARTEVVGPLRLKGKQAAVTAYRLLGVVDEDPEVTRRFDVPFTGRLPELEAISRDFAGVLDDAAPRLLTVHGEAGMGKTRLVHEWRGSTHREFGYGSGRCRPYGEHGSLAPLADALRQLLRESADQEQPAEADASLAVLSAGLLQDGTPSPSVEDTCAAVTGLLSVLSRSRPVVLMLDDCQWAGDTLLDMLAALSADPSCGQVLFLCVARPELLERRPDWARGQSRSSFLALGGLSSTEAAAVADALSAVRPDGHATGVPARAGTAVPPEVLESAGGNPFYLEQLIAALTRSESGRGPEDGGELPTSLQALLGARIGALGRAERTTLDIAAVVGREFTDADVWALVAGDRESRPGGALHTGGHGLGLRGAEVRAHGVPEVGPALTNLRRRRLVGAAEREEPGTRALRFSSGLIHEVTYRSMAKRVRAERHVRAAELLASRLRGSPHRDERRDTQGKAAVARHLELAHGYRRELGLLNAPTDDLRLQAARLLIESASQALSRSDLSWAQGLLDRAVNLCSEGEPEWAAAARRLGEVRLATGQIDEGRSLLLAVLANGREDDATESVVEAAHARLSLSVVSADPAGGGAEDVAQQALPVFEQAGDDLGQARACIRMAQAHQLHGRHGRADTLLTRALEHAVRSGAERERAQTLGAIAVSLWRGPEPVAAAVTRCRGLLSEHGEQRPTVRLTLNCPLAVLFALQEHWEQAYACLAVARRLAGELGYAEGAVILPLFTAEVETLAGNGDRALGLLDEAAQAARALKADGMLGTLARESARRLVLAGRTEEAAARLGPMAHPDGAAADLARADAADLDGLLARIAVARQEREEAAALSARAVRSAGETESPVVQAIAWLDRAEVLFGSGRAVEAREAAGQAGRRFRAKGHLPGARHAAELGAVRVPPTGAHGNTKGC